MKCQRCTEEAAPGRLLCEKHLELRREATQKHREKMQAAGLCECGNEPLAANSKRYGERCLVLNRKVIVPQCSVCKVTGHTQKDHRYLGICWYCPEKVLLGSNLCRTHHEERLEREHKQAKGYREERQRLGLCLICNGKAVNKTRCKKHVAYAARWEKGRVRG